MDHRDRAEETLYLYNLIGRLVTVVKVGRGSHEHRLATQLLHAADAWQYLTEYKMLESIRDVKDQPLPFIMDVSEHSRPPVGPGR